MLFSVNFSPATQERVGVNTKNPLGLTALHLAAQLGYFDIAKFLLSQYCEVDPQGFVVRKHALALISF